MASLLAAWGMIPLAILVSVIPVGMLVDKTGIRWSIGIGIAAFGIVGTARGFSPNYSFFLISVFIYGCLLPFTYQLLSKTIGLFFEARRTGMAIGILQALFGLAGSVAFMFSGTVFSSAFGGWRNLLYLLGAGSIILAFLWIATIRDPSLARQGAVPIPRRPMVGGTITRLARNRDLRILCLISFLSLGAWIGASGTLPFLLKNARGLSPQSANNLMSLATWSWVMGALVLSYLSDRVRNRIYVLFSGCVVSGLGLFMLCISDSTLTWLWACLWGFAGGAVVIIIPLLLDVPGIDARNSGAAIGMVSGMGNLGAFVFPMVIAAFILNTDQSIITLGIFCGLLGYTLAGLLSGKISYR
uniref:Nitrate/nitrite transporter NarK n=1 Tax=Candidatus Kentrum sp. TC TaxID=2126339 RepID=A0A450ZFY8_9GAMM|nr:MAG: Nitrate/nitrite transporter NarK [Candidatus Kentron sp. TC]